MNRWVPSVLLLCLLGCEGTPHGPIEGAGQGATPTLELDQASVLDKLAPLPDPISEVEPNNSVAQASPLHNAEAVLASLENGKDEDWFEIECAQPQILRVELVAEGESDTILSLYGSKGSRLRRQINNTGPGEGEIISNFVVDGRAYVRVHSRKQKTPRRKKSDATAPSTASKYRLLAVLNPMDLEDEHEPNGGTKRAYPLDPSLGVRGYLNNREDVDIFKVPAPAPGSSGWDITLSTPSPARLIAFRKDKRNGTSTRIPAGELARLEGLRVSDKAPLWVAVESDGGYHVTRPYRLRLRPTRIAPSELHEPNDTPSTAVPISLDIPVNGLIGWPQDRDWYQVKCPGQGLLRVDLGPLPGVTLQIEGKDATGNVLIESTGQPGEGVTLPNVACGTGNPLFQVSATGGGFHDQTPYVLHVSWRGGAGEEKEPNDSPAQALTNGPVSTRAAKRGFIGWTNDVDLYHLDLREAVAGQILTLRVKAPPGVALRARLLTVEKDELAATEIIPARETRTATTYLEPDSYLIEVLSIGGGSNGDTPYSISVLP